MKAGRSHLQDLLKGKAEHVRPIAGTINGSEYRVEVHETGGRKQESRHLEPPVLLILILRER